MPRLKDGAVLLEERRRRAAASWDMDLSWNEVGRRRGCNASSVMSWLDAEGAA